MKTEQTKRIHWLITFVLGVILTSITQGATTPTASVKLNPTAIPSRSRNHAFLGRERNANGEEIGSLKGNLDVSATGQAQYTIPIEAPPGTAGMAPTLSIQYDSSSSNTKNGLLGMGFSLQGLTTIVRVPQNKAMNGKIHGVDFSNEDRFALDGQPFVAMNGTYGEGGTEYRTYENSYSRIISNSRQGTGPQSFKVWTKGGQIAEYGVTDDSRLRANIKTPEGQVIDGETVSLWSLDKIEDRAGNYLQVHYQNEPENGMLYPVEIDYTGNDAQGLKPYNAIKLIYEERPDIKETYHAGSRTYTNKRMKAIQVLTGIDTETPQIVYTYSFKYGQSRNTDRSRLESIQKCDGTGVCLPATKFDWQTNEEGWDPADGYTPPIPIVNTDQSANRAAS